MNNLQSPLFIIYLAATDFWPLYSSYNLLRS